MKDQAKLLPPVCAVTAISAALLSCTTTSTFDTTDTNSDDRLSTAEVRKALTKGVFDASDTDGDDRVTLEEWKAANPGSEESLFTERDLNKDGVVTRQEFAKHVEDNGTFDRVIAELDPGNDGTVSTADFDAFTKKHQLDR